MSLERFGKLLIELSELSVDEKSIVFIHLAKGFGFCTEPKDTDAVSEPVDRGRKPYTERQVAEFFSYASKWRLYTKPQRQKIVEDLAAKDGRTPKAIAWQITSRMTT